MHQSMKPTIHLVIGSTGAGKSTYARQLAEKTSGARFAIDEWITALYGEDRPVDADYHWYRERIDRATDKIWRVASQLVNLGMDSVLEIGLTQHVEREKFYQRVREAGVTLRLHVLDAPREVRWQRVEQRNQHQGETFSMEVTRGMFDFVEEMWEPPKEEEMREWKGQHIDSSKPGTSGKTRA